MFKFNPFFIFPTIALILFTTFLYPFNQPFAQDQLIPGEIQHHAPDEEIIWDWYTYVPEGLMKSEKCYILITASGGDSNYENDKVIVSAEMDSKRFRADPLNFVQLGIVIPRPEEPSIYCIAFPQEVFFEETDDFLGRPDLKANLMIDRFIDILKSAGYNVDSQVFLEGYSNGGQFAYGYSILQPERVKAISAGGIQFLVFPDSLYEEKYLDWPIGVNNYSLLTGFDFNRSAFLKIPKHIYIGSQDVVWYNDILGDVGVYPDSSLVDFINNTFGNSPPERLNNICIYLNELGCNIDFKLYEGFGHEYTPEMKDDAFAFFAQYIESGTGDDGSGSGGSGGLGCFINSIRNDLI